jgi:hypothetical protein
MTRWASRFRRRCQQAGSSRRAHRRIAHRACPLCESHDSPAVRDADCSKHPIYQQALASVMNWHECRDCGHVFTEGYSAANAALIVFAKTQPNQTVGYDMEPQRRCRRSSSPASRAACRRGAGSLPVLATARCSSRRRNGDSLPPDSISARRTSALLKLGYEAHCLPIEELDHKARYSVISMADMLEHMPFPKTGLAAAHRLLRPDGVLFLSMPNMDNMVWRLQANGVNPIGADRALPQVFWQAALRSCKTMALGRSNITSASATASAWR